MKKTISFLAMALIVFFNSHIFSQVTIGKLDPPDPSAVLQVIAPDYNKGVLVPELTTTQMKAISNPADGLLIYNATESSFYYFNASSNAWNTLGGASPWKISGMYTPATSNLDNIYQMGSVTVGDSSAVDPTAALNIIAADKGGLFPRVALTSSTDVTTIANPTTGLLVYNTGAAGLQYAGYVFWNGQNWVTLAGGSLAPGTIGSITCNAVSLTPPVYETGKPYEGTMTVPYTGSNGGVYSAMTLGPVNGLTATLASGNFTPGAGTLSFAVTGTPTVTTPNVTTFSVNIGGQTCDAIIGAGDGIAPGDLVFYATPEIPANFGSGDNNTGNVATNWLSNYVNDLPVVGGKLRLDAYFSGTGTGGGSVNINPRLVNFTSNNVKVFFSAMTTVDRFNGSNVVLQPNGWINLDNGLYYTPQPNQTMSSPSTTQYVNGANGNTEVLTCDLMLDNKWYRIYYYPIVDNKDQTNVANMVRKVYLSIQRLY